MTMIVLFTEYFRIGKNAEHQIIYDLQFLQVTFNKQARQHFSVYLRAPTN